MSSSNNNNNPSTMTRNPFDIIVVISPDAQAAQTVQALIAATLPSSTPLLNGSNDKTTTALISADGIMFISSWNPYGCDMGSGGGTVAALSEADALYRQWQTNSNEADIMADSTMMPTVLIFHADGESSRCPADIVNGSLVMGTAWASLPVEQPPAQGAIGQSLSLVINRPILTLLSSLSNVFSDVPRGSVIVMTSSDVLLFFADIYSPMNAQTKINFNDLQDTDDDNGVIGLVVPVPVHTIQDDQTRRVHVLESQPMAVQGTAWQIQPTYQLLQNIQPEQWICGMNLNTGADGPLKLNRRVNFTFMTDQPHHCHEMAWVDTGAIAFLPSAAGALRELMLTTLKECTKRGLEEMYEERYDGGTIADETRPSLKEFAHKTSHKVCLYDHVLKPMCASSLELTEMEDSTEGLQKEVYEKLANHKLYTCTIPTGFFIDLGNTGKLVDCLTVGLTDVRRLGPTRIAGFKREKMMHSMVFNSVLVAGGGDDSRVYSTIGKGSVLEHCQLECTEGTIRIGERCFVSGIRGSLKGSSFRVSSGMCLQLFSLGRESNNRQGVTPTTNSEATPGRSFVCICLGVDDAIENAPPDTLFGLELQRILERSDLVEDDLWDASIPTLNRTLWNAKINPVLSANDHDDGTQLDFSFLDWIHCLKESLMKLDGVVTPEAARGLEQWRMARRLSLSEILSRVDVPGEERYRSSVSSRMSSMGV